MNITVVGIGYVGLSMAVLLARRHHVTAVDILPERVDSVNNRMSPVRDRDIDGYLREGEPDLRATTDAASAYRDADFVIIATPTDFDPGRNALDTSAVEDVIRQALRWNPDAVLVIRSTVPVGFTASMGEKYPGTHILFSPEFLRESSALHDNLYPDRIIVGTDMGDEAHLGAAKRFATLLREGVLMENVETRIMGSREAEAVKLFANTCLALRVAFFNELDTFAEARGLDAGQIIDGVCLDGRIGRHYNNPSFGYGGCCLPKDTKQLLAGYGDVPQCLIGAVVESNEARMDYIADRVLELARDRVGENGAPEEIVIGVYRLSMKRGSDDLRGSAAQEIARRLRERGAEVVIYEPVLGHQGTAFGCRIIDDPEAFKEMSTVILANRADAGLADVREKVYTRDLFGRD